MKRNFCLAIMIIVCMLSGQALSAVMIQDDTVKVMEVDELPIIDGIEDDNCWNDLKWQTIDQVWINYGETIEASDFSGRYKIAWSSETNVIYMLVEIVDDVFVDGYVYNSNPSTGGGYPNYDIFEVFIDQDKSGGKHVFDGTGNVGQQWGYNGENAFSYHIVTSPAPEGQATHDIVVCDIAGESWGNYYIPNYADHIPEFALRKFGSDRYIWEFSMNVYNDTYEPANPEISRVVLQPGDIMGFSVAYCENDDPDEDPKERDNFIGSVWVPASAFNDHWMDADGFGTIELVGKTTGVAQYNEVVASSDFRVYPNPGTGNFNLQLHDLANVNTIVRVFNVLGQQVYEFKPAANRETSVNEINLNHLPDGIYFLSTKMHNQIVTRKITIMR